MRVKEEKKRDQPKIKKGRGKSRRKEDMRKEGTEKKLMNGGKERVERKKNNDKHQACETRK